MANFRLLDPGRKFTDSNGDPASGYQLFVYDAGTTTKATAFKDSAGAANHTNPIVLESDGGLPNRELWVATGSYKLVLASDTDTDPPTSGTTIGDNLDPINDVASNSASEWTPSGLTPTYVDGDTFTVPGDQTSLLHVGRRLQITDGGGTVYATISSVSYSDPTTTVNLSVDGSDTIDSSVSAVSYGLISAVNSSVATGMRKLMEGTVSAAASLDITGLSSNYAAYRIILTNLAPATNNTTLILRMSNDGGSSFVSTNSYQHARAAATASGSVSAAGSNSEAYINLGASYGNAAGEDATVDLTVYRPGDASTRTWAMFKSSRDNEASVSEADFGHGVYTAEEAVDAIRVAFFSGNISSCDYVVYGIAA